MVSRVTPLATGIVNCKPMTGVMSNHICPTWSRQRISACEGKVIIALHQGPAYNREMKDRRGQNMVVKAWQGRRFRGECSLLTGMLTRSPHWYPRPE